VIDEVPGLGKRAVSSALCCPHCIAQNPHSEPVQFQLRQLVKQEMTCERTGEVISLHTADLAANRVIGKAAVGNLFVEPVPNDKELKYGANRVKYGRPIEDQTSLYHLLGLESQERADQLLKEGGEATIMQEILDYYNNFESFEAMQNSRDEFDWTDYDWSRYCNDEPGEDEPAKLGAYKKLYAKAVEHGFDKERPNRQKGLDYFLQDKICSLAGLNRAHILALRLYSSTVSRCINGKLNAGCSTTRPHPYPCLVLILVDALHRLSTAQTNQRQQAIAKAKMLGDASRKAKEDPDLDDSDKAKAAKRAADAAAISESLQCNCFWRGVHDLDFEELADRSAMEVCFMSVSKDRAVATQDALTAYTAGEKAKAEAEAAIEAEAAEDEELAAKRARAAEEKANIKQDPPVLLFRVSPVEDEMPADLGFLTVFPKEQGWVYPPGVILESKKDSKDYLMPPDAEGERIECTTVEMVPRLRLKFRKEEKKKG